MTMRLSVGGGADGARNVHSTATKRALSLPWPAARNSGSSPCLFYAINIMLMLRAAHLVRRMVARRRRVAEHSSASSSVISKLQEDRTLTSALDPNRTPHRRRDHHHHGYGRSPLPGHY